MRVLIFILVTASCGPPKISTESPPQATNATDLPVVIRYSKSVPYPPDSVVDFIRVYLMSKGVQVIDTTTANNLQQMEIERVWHANVKKGDPLPAPGELNKKMNTVGHTLVLSVYKKPAETSFIIDSVRWSVFYIPFSFEKAGKYGIFRTGKNKEKSLFDTLKEISDTLLLSVLTHKKK